ncbi:MAG: efflux RND transporter periplasmic adaptor subunit [Patescibacteria group bacterium]|nr:efflux RND transporter periplasmic adaptor subunit [Patescibacteria group bacterium]
MKISKSKFFIFILIILVAAGVLYFLFNQKASVEYTVAKVVKGNLTQTISETGTVKSTNEIDLSFSLSGKIADIFTTVGDKVKKDQILAELDNSDLLLKAREAEANLRVAEANLAKLLAGATAAELAVSQASVDQAKTSYDSALSELGKTRNTTNEDIRQAEKNLSDLKLTSGSTITSYARDVQNYRAAALTTMAAKISIADNALDNINTILNDNDAKNYLSAGNMTLLDEVKKSYDLALPTIDLAQAGLAAAESSQSDENIIKALTDSFNTLNKTFSALNNCYTMLQSSMVSTTFTQAELDAYKTAISTQQTNVSTAITSVQTAQHNFSDSLNDLNNEISAAEDALATAKVEGEQQITAAQSKVDTAYMNWQLTLAQLNKLKDKARDQDVNLSKAQVAQAQAALDLIHNQINNNIIKAPADGTITKKNYESGEQASGAKPVFSMLGVNNFEIEIDVSEADINKVALNNPAEITLDAFGEDIKFYGRVNFIEPAETVIQDVTYYKVKINFDGKDKNVKSGMTANANITTARKDNILIMPARAVVEKNGSGKFVRLLVNQEMKEEPVTIGLRGDGGLVEALSGVSEGDTVVTYIKQGK